MKNCHLRKSLYGLKQSHQAWFGKFSQAIEKFGMQKSKANYFVFYRNSKACIILLVVYVDDIVITGSDTTAISSLKSFLHGHFHTKYFLGVEVMRSKCGILLSQRKHVLDLLSKKGKLGAKPRNTPMAPSLQLIREGELFVDPERYKRVVRKLNHLTVTRPDITHSINVTSKYMSSPTTDLGQL